MARTAPRSPSSWSLGACSILEGRKIAPRRVSKALRGKEATRGTQLAWGRVPPAPPHSCGALRVPHTGVPMPYRRRGLQAWLPTVTLGAPSPWEKRRKDRSSPSSWDLWVERKTSGTLDCKEGGQGSAPGVPAARRGARAAGWTPYRPGGPQHHLQLPSVELHAEEEAVQELEQSPVAQPAGK